MIPTVPILIREHRMRSLICLASVVVLLAVAGWVSHPAGAASDDETPSIKKIMKTLHGKGAPVGNVSKALKSDSPDWPKVTKDAETIVKYSAYLPKLEPPKGDKESYEKLAKAYESSAKTLKTTAEKEDLDGARAASKKLGASCKACHTAHKGA
jgi:cytochrome c556